MSFLRETAPFIEIFDQSLRPCPERGSLEGKGVRVELDWVAGKPGTETRDDGNQRSCRSLHSSLKLDALCAPVTLLQLQTGCESKGIAAFIRNPGA